ncbi:MAG TPA: alpha/beta fold hydrolase [Acidimicrobiales bacterium]|nr:alpha/beta fold hydrolase [Acidimicrobiales bacterium]
MTPARRIEANGLDFTALEAGDGGRPILLVHGFTGAKEDFEPAIEPLAAEGWHVVAPDLRGHGGSAHPPGRESYSFELFTADVVALADALGWERFVLVGHSMGGMVAQLVALHAPERLRALVLMNTSHGPPDGYNPVALDMGRDLVRQGGMELLVAVRREIDKSGEPPAHRRLVEEEPDYRAFHEGKTLAASPDMWLAMVDEMFSQADRLDALAGLEVPTLVVVGDQDASFRAQSERMGRTVPGARLVVIPGAGHLPQFETPDEWWSALTGFLSDLD